MNISCFSICISGYWKWLLPKCKQAGGICLQPISQWSRVEEWI